MVASRYTPSGRGRSSPMHRSTMTGRWRAAVNTIRSAARRLGQGQAAELAREGREFGQREQVEAPLDAFGKDHVLSQLVTEFAREDHAPLGIQGVVIGTNEHGPSPLPPQAPPTGVRLGENVLPGLWHW